MKTMTAAQNKQLLQDVFAETAKGNGRPFVAAMAEDVAWTIIGSTPWSKTYRGKKAVLTELLGPLNAQLANGNSITAHRFIAENDQVVVEGRGHNTTKTGKAYQNAYCWVFRFSEGKVVELMEYTDTALIESALKPPEDSAAA
jgi:ketosteroid isomerase-like protein